jgi:hypothetical protein
MKAENIEQLLDDGVRIGFMKPTHDDEYLGWIIISKYKPDQRALDIASSIDNSRSRDMLHRAAFPYMLLVIELKKSVHEAGGYETEDDYRLKERHWFASLVEVAKQISLWGYSLEQAKDARELDAP